MKGTRIAANCVEKEQNAVERRPCSNFEYTRDSSEQSCIPQVRKNG